MKKWLLIILSTMLLFSVKNCYASDSNIIVDTYRNENFVLEFSIGNDKIYGFSTTLDYDSSKFKLNNCTAHNGYEISTYQNNIVVESINAKNNVKAATCYFEILDSKETSLTIKNINTGNYDEVIVEKDMQLQVLGNKTPTQVENIPDTAKGIGMGYILLGCTLTICGGVIIFLLFNKKYSILCSIAIALCLIIPGRVDAAKNKINLSETDLSGARDILLGKAESNLDYDFDGDEKITINDLVITKVDLSKLQVTFEPNGTGGKTAYTSLSMKYRINSTSKIESVETCIKSSAVACNYQKVSATFTNSYVSDSSGFGVIGNAPQQMCVKVTNKDNISREVCSNMYLIDPTNATLSLDTSKSRTIEGCYRFYENLTREKDSYFKANYGFSGGNTTVSLGNGNAGFGYHEYTLNGLAIGNNGSRDGYGCNVRCNKKILFAGDSLASSPSNNYSVYFSVNPMIKTSAFNADVSNSNISSLYNAVTSNNDYVVVSLAVRTYSITTDKFVDFLSKVKSSNPYAKIVVVILGNYNSSSDVAAYVGKAKNFGTVIDCGSKSTCFNNISAAGGFLSMENLYLNQKGSELLYNNFIKKHLN